MYYIMFNQLLIYFEWRLMAWNKKNSLKKKKKRKKNVLLCGAVSQLVFKIKLSKKN